MPSRRISAAANLAPFQEIAVNPYSGFNSDNVNMLTRIVTGKKDEDFVVSGLDAYGVNQVNSEIPIPGEQPLPTKLVYEDEADFDSVWNPNRRQNVELTPDGKITTIKVDGVASARATLVHTKDPEVEWIGKFAKITVKLSGHSPKALHISIGSETKTIEHPQDNVDIETYLQIVDHNAVFNPLTINIDVDQYDKYYHGITQIEKVEFIVLQNRGLPIEALRDPTIPDDNIPEQYLHPHKFLTVTPGVCIKDETMINITGAQLTQPETPVITLEYGSEDAWLGHEPFTADDFKGSTYLSNNDGSYQTVSFNNGLMTVDSLDDGQEGGPRKVCGDSRESNTNKPIIQWAYLCVYYAYFKHVNPNKAYIGLAKESEVTDARYGEDYLILGKLRFIDKETVDAIIYYPQRKDWGFIDASKVTYNYLSNLKHWINRPINVSRALDLLAYEIYHMKGCLYFQTHKLFEEWKAASKATIKKPCGYGHGPRDYMKRINGQDPENAYDLLAYVCETNTFWKSRLEKTWQIDDIKIIDRGTGYSVGDRVVVSTDRTSIPYDHWEYSAAVASVDTADCIDSVSITGGSNYQIGNVITISPTGHGTIELIVSDVDENGAVVNAFVQKGGTSYSIGDTITIEQENKGTVVATVTSITPGVNSIVISNKGQYKCDIDTQVSITETNGNGFKGMAVMHPVKDGYDNIIVWEELQLKTFEVDWSNENNGQWPETIPSDWRWSESGGTALTAIDDVKAQWPHNYYLVMAHGGSFRKVNPFNPHGTGSVPAPITSEIVKNKFLRADGTWQNVRSGTIIFDDYYEFYEWFSNGGSGKSGSYKWKKKTNPVGEGYLEKVARIPELDCDALIYVVEDSQWWRCPPNPAESQDNPTTSDYENVWGSWGNHIGNLSTRYDVPNSIKPINNSFEVNWGDAGWPASNTAAKNRGWEWAAAIAEVKFGSGNISAERNLPILDGGTGYIKPVAGQHTDSYDDTNELCYPLVFWDEGVEVNNNHIAGHGATGYAVMEDDLSGGKKVKYVRVTSVGSQYSTNTKVFVACKHEGVVEWDGSKLIIIDPGQGYVNTPTQISIGNNSYNVKCELSNNQLLEVNLLSNSAELENGDRLTVLNNDNFTEAILSRTIDNNGKIIDVSILSDGHGKNYPFNKVLVNDSISNDINLTIKTIYDNPLIKITRNTSSVEPEATINGTTLQPTYSIYPTYHINEIVSDRISVESISLSGGNNYLSGDSIRIINGSNYINNENVKITGKISHTDTATATISNNNGKIEIIDITQSAGVYENNETVVLTAVNGGHLTNNPIAVVKTNENGIIQSVIISPIVAKAKVHSTLNNSVYLDSITNKGDGYIYPPAISITGSSGSGAQAEAIIQDGKVNNIIMRNPGYGYQNPEIIIQGPPVFYALVDTVDENGAVLTIRDVTSQNLLNNDIITIDGVKIKYTVGNNTETYTVIESSYNHQIDDELSHNGGTQATATLKIENQIVLDDLTIEDHNSYDNIDNIFSNFKIETDGNGSGANLEITQQTTGYGPFDTDFIHVTNSKSNDILLSCSQIYFNGKFYVSSIQLENGVINNSHQMSETDNISISDQTNTNTITLFSVGGNVTNKYVLTTISVPTNINLDYSYPVIFNTSELSAFALINNLQSVSSAKAISNLQDVNDITAVSSFGINANLQYDKSIACNVLSSGKRFTKDINSDNNKTITPITHNVIQKINILSSGNMYGNTQICLYKNSNYKTVYGFGYISKFNSNGTGEITICQKDNSYNGTVYGIVYDKTNRKNFEFNTSTITDNTVTIDGLSNFEKASSVAYISGLDQQFYIVSDNCHSIESIAILNDYVDVGDTTPTITIKGYVEGSSNDSECQCEPVCVNGIVSISDALTGDGVILVDNVIIAKVINGSAYMLRQVNIGTSSSVQYISYTTNYDAIFTYSGANGSQIHRYDKDHNNYYDELNKESDNYKISNYSILIANNGQVESINLTMNGIDVSQYSVRESKLIVVGITNDTINHNIETFKSLFPYEYYIVRDFDLETTDGNNYFHYRIVNPFNPNGNGTVPGPLASQIKDNYVLSATGKWKSFVAPGTVALWFGYFDNSNIKNAVELRYNPGWLVMAGQPITYQQYPELFNQLVTIFHTRSTDKVCRLPNLLNDIIVIGNSNKDPNTTATAFSYNLLKAGYDYTHSHTINANSMAAAYTLTHPKHKHYYSHVDAGVPKGHGFTSTELKPTYTFNLNQHRNADETYNLDAHKLNISLPIRSFQTSSASITPDSQQLTFARGIYIIKT